jgi:hypothetical protein
MPHEAITTLADELYVLMTGDGATPAAIRAMPALMSLAYITAQAPNTDGNAREDAIAATVRAFIEEATYVLEEPMSEREDKDVDRGAAARCLLGLYPGTSAMLLAERRKRAASHLVKDVRTITKRRERKGRMVSYEMLLMEQLASELWERETDFLRDSNHSGDVHDENDRDSPLLAAVSDVWSTAGDIQSNIDYCVGALRPQPGDDYPLRSDYASLELLARFWQLVRIPPEHDPFLADVDEPDDVLTTLFPEGLVALLFVLSPFGRDTIERLSRTELILPPEILSSEIVHELIPHWHEWLGSCHCQPLEPQESCSVHRFQEILGSYIKQLDKCWVELQDPHRSPLSYKSRRSPAETMEYYAIRQPIDK